jgi:hypothetical protein
MTRLLEWIVGQGDRAAGAGPGLGGADYRAIEFRRGRQSEDVCPGSLEAQARSPREVYRLYF